MLKNVQNIGWLYLICIVGFSYGCAPTNSNTENPEIPNSFSHISDIKAKEILQKSIEAMGGLAKWEAKKSLAFTKDYQLLMENGEIENALFQHHLYTYKPRQSVNISWESKEGQNMLSYIDGEPTKTINGSVDSIAKHQSLINTVLSSMFVVEIPYKFLDSGAEISYAGKDTLEDGTAVETIQIDYNPNNYDNHSTQDTWWAYFSEKDYRLTAYMVKHADHYSYVRNLSDTIVDGFTFVKERESYRVDSLRNLLYLRATYVYDNYKVSFSEK